MPIEESNDLCIRNAYIDVSFDILWKINDVNGKKIFIFRKDVENSNRGAKDEFVARFIRKSYSSKSRLIRFIN